MNDALKTPENSRVVEGRRVKQTNGKDDYCVVKKMLWGIGVFIQVDLLEARNLNLYLSFG